MSDASIKAALADDGLMEIIHNHSVEYLKGYQACMKAASDRLFRWAIMENDHAVNSAEILGELIERKEAIEADELQAQAMGDKWQ
jgi:hypothetical protein